MAEKKGNPPQIITLEVFSLERTLQITTLLSLEATLQNTTVVICALGENVAGGATLGLLFSRSFAPFGRLPAQGSFRHAAAAASAFTANSLRFVL